MKGEEVKKILKEKGISLASLARKMDKSPQYLQNILRSENISSGRLEEFSNLTGINFYSALTVSEPDILGYFPKTAKPVRDLADINEIDYLRRIDKYNETIIENLKREVTGLNREITGLTAQLNDKQTNIECLEDKISMYEKQFGALGDRKSKAS
jgi:transcriptional regulator with XRE-family HTH domain